MDADQLALTWFGLPNVEKLASTCKFDLKQSERKSLQVHARPGQTVSQVDPCFELASTCAFGVLPRLLCCLSTADFFIIFPFFFFLNRKTNEKDYSMSTLNVFNKNNAYYRQDF